MIIHSKKSDYYDSALAFGRDETLHFVRETRELGNKNKDLYFEGLSIDRKTPWMSNYEVYWGGEYIRLLPIWFCGKIYICITASLGHSAPEFFWPQNDFKGLDQLLENHPRFKEYVDKSYVYTAKKGGRGTIVQRMKESARTKSGREDLKRFIEYGVAYFTTDVCSGYIDGRYDSHWDTIVYPVLKDYNFQVVKDPYTAMQELSMFLGGVIPRQTAEVVNISDKDRIAQHGFNDKSFRHPTKIKDLYGTD